MGGHCLKADRAKYDDWEKFGVEVVRADPSMSIQAPFGQVAVISVDGIPPVDPLLTYHAAFRCKIRALRNGHWVGLHKGKLGFTVNDCVWEMIPHPSRNAYFIRNADHHEFFWVATRKDNRVHVSTHQHEVESAFQLEAK